MLMPYGKHEGEEMEELPSSYLRWLAENLSTKPLNNPHWKRNVAISYEAETILEERDINASHDEYGE